MRDLPATLLSHPSRGVWANIKRYRFLYLLILPTLILYLIYNYLPMYGLVIAFQEYKPFLGLEGMFSKADWVGLKPVSYTHLLRHVHRGAGRR